ncbi:MAG TPA: glycosyltransferase family 39 protein [Planctomycetota bacterium]|nr:glycosyltransferase family 39 protein [Planctomycetota bacterium]
MLREKLQVSRELLVDPNLQGIPGHRLSSFFVLVVLTGVLFCGQWGRGLVTMDDLREAEVAREMAENKETVIPTLAGLPFVEKPPGFPLLLSLAFRGWGAPEVWLARLISAFFGAAAVVGVYLLALRTRGLQTAWIASSLLALSPLFCRVSHEILLDNALAALIAFTLLFLWEGASAPPGRRKRLACLAGGFTLGLAFLVKGFVGPALVASGLIVHAVLARRWRDYLGEHALWCIAGSFVPILCWLVPFCRSAPPGLLRTFFIDNHLMRFSQAYDGHGRPLYFYLLTLGYKLGWATVFLPWAAVDLWKSGRTPDRRADLFFCSFAAGPLLLLSLSKAKEAIYLLPAYPAFALWAGSWVERVVAGEGPARPRLLGLLGLGSLVSALFMSGWACWLGGSGMAMWGVGVALCLGVAILCRGWSRRQPFGVLGGSLLLWGLACLLGVCGPVAAWEDSRQEWPAVTDRILSEARGDDLVLLGPVDELRGALGFFRRRTAREVQSSSELLASLASSPGVLGVLFADSIYHRALLAEAEGRVPPLVERLRIPFRGKTLLLIESSAPKASP